MSVSQHPEDSLAQVQERARSTAKALLAMEPALVEAGEPPPGALDAVRASGLSGLTLPRDHGGHGLGIMASVLVHLELCRAPAVFLREFRTAVGAGTRMLVNHGTDEQKRRWLPGIAAGRFLSAFALTEPQAGSDAAAITTTAERVAGGYLIRGTKSYMATDADVISVLAYTDRAAGAKGGVSAFLVAADTPGLRFGRKVRTMGFSPDYLADLHFDDCLVPDDALIGEEGQGFVYAMECLDENRLNIAAAAVAQGDFALELATQYARSRTAFGQPLARFQAIEHMLAEMAVDLHVARVALLDAAARHEAGERSRVMTPIVKLFCTEAAGRIVDKAVQIHGGAGYCRDHPVERLYRETRLLRIVEGASEIHKNIIARGLMQPARVG